MEPDGSTVAAAGRQGKVILRRAADWRRPTTLPADSSWVWCLAFSPDGSLLAAGGGSATVWNAASRTLVARLPHSLVLGSVAIDPGNKLLATSAADGKVRLWDIASPSPVPARLPVAGGHRPPGSGAPARDGDLGGRPALRARGAPTIDPAPIDIRAALELDRQLYDRARRWAEQAAADARQAGGTADGLVVADVLTLPGARGVGVLSGVSPKRVNPQTASTATSSTAARTSCSSAA
jgi:hypothetical protein